VNAGAFAFEEEIENRTTLLGAGYDDRPDSFEPALASFASRSSSDVPVDHHESNGLLGQVVRRLDPARCDKSDGSLAAFL
jgi:hypothetical protein